MSKYLSNFLETIWFEQKLIQWVVANSKLNSIKDKVKESIEFILENNKKVSHEVEEKILEVNFIGVTQKLLNLWAEEIFDWVIVDNRYDFWNMLFKKNGIILRIRQVWDKYLLTLKKRINQNRDLTSRDLELELVIDDIDSFINILENIWLKQIEWKTYVKHRISYELDWVHFEFDKYLWVPRLLEIEANNKEKIQEWKTKLWLEKHKSVKYWYRRLKEYYWIKEINKYF